ncbi:uncharacterized protein LOC119610469 isoform X1 [Lucilia sericata]|uniref:uncharacterized protein LOC119610469 isoform X1 n=1 Tax=Lucilia sericata TaxID=13632 RepID=UPI0018A7EEEB|nr:uncharacterized protein LOC119610469 isoform X1 [Lucilia sericata]
MFNTEHFEMKFNSLNGTKGSTIGKSTIVAHRLSVHFQNILTPTKSPQKYLEAINHHLAVYREMLINIGQEKDCPELREKIRKLRCTILEECQITAQLLIPLDKSNSIELNHEYELNKHYLVLLFQLLELFLRELTKSYRLNQVITMDMEEYFENRAGPSNLGNVISELLLCKEITPDFNLEELSSIILDTKEISSLLKEIEEFVPQEFNSNVDIHNVWPLKRKRKLFCCGSQSNY